MLADADDLNDGVFVLTTKPAVGIVVTNSITEMHEDKILPLHK